MAGMASLWRISKIKFRWCPALNFAHADVAAQYQRFRDPADHHDA
jgi:hypothetical protein